jgi:spermidine synthase
VVELNPEVTQVARRFFGLRAEHGITSVHGDARAVAEELPPGAWSRIFVDVYDGQEALPYPLVTREAFAVFERLLRPGGTLLINVIGVAVGEGAPRFWSIVRTLAQSFPSVAVYPHLGPDVEGRQNFLLAAASEAERDFPHRAGLFDRLPPGEWPGGEGTIVFWDRFPAADDVRSAPAHDPASGAYDPSAVAR